MAKGSSSARVLLSVVAVLAIVGLRIWSRSSSTPVVNNGNGTFSVSSSDRAMNAAIAKSRQTAPQFIEHLAHPAADELNFAIKVPVRQGEKTEHFWLDQVTYDGTAFHGLIDNDPEFVTNVKVGQPWTCTPSELSDWMYIRHGVLVGGESIRVLRNAMTPKERADFDASLHYKMD